MASVQDLETASIAELFLNYSLLVMLSSKFDMAKIVALWLSQLLPIDICNLRVAIIQLLNWEKKGTHLH